MNGTTPQAWPAAQLALLQQLLADPSTPEGALRSINHLITRVQGTAKRLSPKQRRGTQLQEAALAAITAAEPHGISPQQLLALLPTRSGIANLHGLLSKMHAAGLVHRRKVGHRVMLHTSREHCEAAAAAQPAQVQTAMAMPRAGTLRALMVDAVHQAGGAGRSLDELCALPCFAAYTRLQLCVAGYKLLSGGLLHCTGAQRALRYFATAEQAEAHAATLPPQACNMSPATGMQRAERRQARKDAREANAVARQIRQQAAAPNTGHPAPVAVATRPPASAEPIMPPGLTPTVVPPVRDTRYTADGPVHGDFFDQGIGRHSEPCRGWAQAVAAHIEHKERST